MNRKLVTPRCPRTWHSLWDEMFSAFAELDPEAESAGLDLEGSSSTRTELCTWITERAMARSNDNGSF